MYMYAIIYERTIILKKLFSKTLSVILSIVIVISAVAVCIPAAVADDAPGTDIPLIYVCGQGTPLFKADENGQTVQIYPPTLPEGFIEDAVKENIGLFAKSVFTQEWTDFGNALSDILSELYGPLALDENGSTTDGSWHFNSNQSNCVDGSRVNGKYPTERFTFFYDFRLDPLKVADELHEYIEAVVAATGEKEVALLGRCLGGCITTAYMEKYDGEYVSELIYYCGAQNGATVVSKLFSGNVYLDADGINRFVYDFQLSADEVTDELIKAFVTLFNDTYGLDLTCWAVNNVWEDIYLDIMPQVFIKTFGTWPGYWSMVDDNDYQRAKNNVFHNADTEKYSNFIGIIDNYHYNIQCRLPEILTKFESRGVEISNVSKYGYQAIPLNAPSDLISDNTCQLEEASMGATVASLNTTFSDEYMAAAQANGTAKYIAPDRQVDASTCLFPETTWFIKNLEHKTFPTEMNLLFDAIVNTDGMTVDTNPLYPQFMVFENGAIVPMCSENHDTTQRYNVSFWDALKIFVRNLSKLIKGLIETKIASSDTAA